MAKARIPQFRRPRKIGRHLTGEQLRKLIHYDPETGVFTWRRRDERDHFDRTWNTKNAGKVAGCEKTKTGYKIIAIYDQIYLAHRLAWLYQTDRWPAECIDHINMGRADNRWTNLREATHSENHYNRTIQSNNKSGLKGVYFHKLSKRWHALIAHEGRRISLGYYKTPELANTAYRGAEKVLRGIWSDVDREKGKRPLTIYDMTNESYDATLKFDP